MRLAAALGLAVLAFAAGCGDDGDSSSTSAEDEIRTIVEQRDRDPASICDHMTAELLESVGGAESCRQLAAAEDNQDTSEIESIEVEGDDATVRLRGGQEAGEIVFRRVDGEWRLDTRG